MKSALVSSATRALAVLLMTVCAGGAAWGEAPREEFDQKSDELDRLRQRIEHTRAQLQQQRARLGSEQQQLARLELRVADSAAQLRRLEQRSQVAERRLQTLRTEKQTIEKRMEEQRQRLARQVRAGYAMGRQERLKLLLNQSQPEKLQRVMVYYNYLNRSRVEHIRAAQQALDELREVQDQMAEEQAHLEQLVTASRQRQQELNEARKARQQVLAKLRQRIRTDDHELKQLLDNERRLQQLLDSLDRVLMEADRQTHDFAALKGKLHWPIKGKIVGRFGTRRGAGAMRWRGVLIDAPAGREVQAVAPGRVVFADWLRGYGLLLIVDHGDGFMTLYGQNQSVYKEIGEWVQRGEVVAGVGDSGGQSHSGLYFEIRRQGKPVNPFRWCRAARGSLVGLNP